MHRVTFDLDVLRSFIAGIDLGSYARAAERLGRSTSAVSAQLKKLEEQAGTAVFVKAGRGLALTEEGELLLSYARRLIELNDEAAIALKGLSAEGWIRVGVQQDFGETVLPAVLARFARSHPRVRVEARVGRNAELLDRVVRGQLDLALVWDDRLAIPYAERIAEWPMHWIGPANGAPLVTERPLQLVGLDETCRFRTAGIAALDRAGRPWEMAFTSTSLGGVWAGVAAGFGVTVRTRAGLPAGLRVLEGAERGWPALPSVALSLAYGEVRPGDLPARLGAMIREEVHLAAPAEGR